MSVVRFVLVLTPNTILPPPVFGILTSVSLKTRSVLWSTFAFGKAALIAGNLRADAHTPGPRAPTNGDVGDLAGLLLRVVDLAYERGEQPRGACVRTSQLATLAYLADQSALTKLRMGHADPDAVHTRGRYPAGYRRAQSTPSSIQRSATASRRPAPARER
jgi:hypothetical protein